MLSFELLLPVGSQHLPMDVLHALWLFTWLKLIGMLALAAHIVIVPRSSKLLLILKVSSMTFFLILSLRLRLVFSFTSKMFGDLV